MRALLTAGFVHIGQGLDCKSFAFLRCAQVSMLTIRTKLALHTSVSVDPAHGCMAPARQPAHDDISAGQSLARVHLQPMKTSITVTIIGG